MYRIPMINTKDPRKLSKRKGPSKNACIILRRVKKIITEGRGREGYG